MKRQAPHMAEEKPQGSDNERGAVLVVTAFIFIALMGVSALVIDIVTIHQARLRAQATADASVLAAALDLSDVESAAAVAQEYAKRNFDVADGDWASCVDADALAVATTVPCISVNDEDPHTLIRVRIPDRKIPSFFASVLGHTGFNVSASAIAEVEFVVTSPGTPGGPGIDPFAPSVRDGYAGGWPTCDDPDFWMVEKPDVVYDKKGKAKEPKDGQWREYIFVFEHTDGTTTTLCDTNRWTGSAKETNFPNAGGDTVEGLDEGIDVHVSCSQNFADEDGWDLGRHPNPVDDPEWRIVFYRLDRRNSDDPFPVGGEPCEGSSFNPVFATPPVVEPIIRLYG
jgi:Flp pilus assembly protein TadG